MCVCASSSLEGFTHSSPKGIHASLLLFCLVSCFSLSLSSTKSLSLSSSLLLSCFWQTNLEESEREKMGITEGESVRPRVAAHLKSCFSMAEDFQSPLFRLSTFLSSLSLATVRCVCPRQLFFFLLSLSLLLLLSGNLRLGIPGIRRTANRLTGPFACQNPVRLLFLYFSHSCLSLFLSLSLTLADLLFLILSPSVHFCP